MRANESTLRFWFHALIWFGLACVAFRLTYAGREPTLVNTFISFAHMGLGMMLMYGMLCWYETRTDRSGGPSVVTYGRPLFTLFWVLGVFEGGMFALYHYGYWPPAHWPLLLPW